MGDRLRKTNQYYTIKSNNFCKWKIQNIKTIDFNWLIFDVKKKVIYQDYNKNSPRQ